MFALTACTSDWQHCTMCFAFGLDSFTRDDRTVSVRYRRHATSINGLGFGDMDAQCIAFSFALFSQRRWIRFATGLVQRGVNQFLFSAVGLLFCCPPGDDVLLSTVLDQLSERLIINFSSHRELSISIKNERLPTSQVNCMCERRER